MIYSFESSELPLSALHDALVDAFSDYIVPMKPTFEQFKAMLDSRGFDPSLTTVEIRNDMIVAFWIIGRRGDAAYVITSGTRPLARKQGLAGQIGTEVIKTLKQDRLGSLTLEVINGNDGARHLYERLGFSENRQLNCYSLTANPNAKTAELKWADVRDTLATLRKSNPSWQNADETLDALSPDAVAANNAAAAFDQSTGVVFQIAGDVSQIVGQLAAPDQLRFINIDGTDHTLNNALLAVGADQFLSQTEMIVKLGN